METAVALAAPIDPGSLVLSEHACDRFRERVRPTLDAGQARRHLERLIGEHGRFVAEPPRWLADRQRAEPADAYVLVGDDVVVPVRECGGRPVALTCLTRTGISELARRCRNRRRQALTARRRARRGGRRRERRRR